MISSVQIRVDSRRWRSSKLEEGDEVAAVPFRAGDQCQSTPPSGDPVGMCGCREPLELSMTAMSMMLHVLLGQGLLGR